MARSRRFTVDQVPDLPDWGLRSEVLDGRLVLAPPASRRHERAVGNLAARFWHVLPLGSLVRSEIAVRLPDGDGPVPDLAVVADPGRRRQRVVPAAAVPTVVEVVGPDGRGLDRVWKRERYAESGIPCYWRVELEPWPGYRGPLPVLVIRLRERSAWREIIAPAGQVHALPVAYGRGPDGAALTVPVRLDPLSLPVRHATTW